ncbi:hypothetical protein STEG23_006285, partial [Scotinomys teguina]
MLYKLDQQDPKENDCQTLPRQEQLKQPDFPYSFMAPYAILFAKFERLGNSIRGSKKKSDNSDEVPKEKEGLTGTSGKPQLYLQWASDVCPRRKRLEASRAYKQKHTTMCSHSEMSADQNQGNADWKRRRLSRKSEKERHCNAACKQAIKNTAINSQ